MFFKRLNGKCQIETCFRVLLLNCVFRLHISRGDSGRTVMGKNFIGLVLLLSIIFSAVVQGGEQIERIRRRENFNAGWRFIKEDVKNAEAFDFDDSNWRGLNLPHDWAIEGPFTKEVSFRAGYLPYPGVGWYRKAFTIPSDTKCVRIEFDGVMRDARVWLNGKYIGGWPYGYSSFSFDLTDHVRRGQINVIAVRVENEDNSSRWYPGSGIYRNVWLTFTGPVHVEHWGTFITADRVSEEKAHINVRTQVRNQSEEAQDVILETIIYDAEGDDVSRNTDKKHIDKETSKEFKQELKVLDPIRWDIKSPYLYKAVSEVKIAGETVDRYETKFGIRTLRLDPGEGFFLNGRNIKLKGVNLHHGLGPLGIAFSRRAAERQLEIMKEMGCNAIRTAHNPPAPEQLDLCDEMGLLVIDETFDEWKKPKVPNGYNKLFDEWAEKDTRALLKRDRNHPSIIFWGTGNEIPELDTVEGKKNARMFTEICRELDPTRPVTSGIHLTKKLDEELADCFDVLGLNYWQDRYEDIHRAFGNKPLLSTESSAVVSTRGEYHFPVRRVPTGYRDKSLQISSYDIANCGFGDLPDVEFKLQQEHEWLMGEFVWSGFDYHGEPDPYEDMWPAHSSYFGIVDMCGFKKDRFYLYQSQWTDEPMIHLLPHWNWDGREGEVTPVYCYTNCASAELFVNGRSFGKKEKGTSEFRLKWNEVVYRPGSIKAVGYDDKGKVLCEKEIRTAGKPYKIELVADRETIKADGEDLCFVTVRIVDRQGKLCPLADNLVSFKVEGEGEVACVGNGNPISHEPYQARQRRVFHGLCLVVVRSTRREGGIKLKATSEGLLDEQILLQTKGNLILSESATYAEDAPAMEWHKGHGTDNGEKPQHVMQTSDGGYLMVGMTDEARGRASDMLIVKTDAGGDGQWQKIIGTSTQHDWANISAEVADGYIVAGALSESGDQERCIVKLDFDGDIVSGWPKTYHADGADAIRGIDITSDGCIVATGYVGGRQSGYLFICDSGKGSILKTDADGKLQWEKILPSTMHGMRVQEVAGGFAIGGNQWISSGEDNHQDVVLVLTDSDGDETFHKYYGGDGDDQVFDFAVTTDGGYIFGGHSRSPSYGTVNWDFFLLKVGSDKKEQWHRTFGQPRGYDAKYIHDEAYGVGQTGDGGFIIAGGSGDEFPYSESGHPAGPSDEWKAYLVRTDAGGNVQWEGLYPRRSAGGNNAAEHINLTSDGGYILCTDTDTAPGPAPNNFGLMKIASQAPERGAGAEQK
jgi:beta-galactosidase